MKTKEEIKEKIEYIEKIIKYPCMKINEREYDRLRGYLQALHFCLGEIGY